MGRKLEDSALIQETKTGRSQWCRIDHSGLAGSLSHGGIVVFMGVLACRSELMAAAR